ncbi:MAG: ammonium transporter [Alphaproteobacteria bacterium]|nr:ammonium transporter [Alphaproteobacteria bacterium]
MHHSVRAARRRLAFLLPAAPAFLLAASTPAWAADTGAIDAGNTAWVLIASALVLFMTLPGLGLFYGGLVRARNLLSVLMHCFVICSIVSVIWLLYGYSLAFADGNSLLGGLSKCFLAGVAQGIHPPRIPEYVFALFQMTFAVITPALIIGAFPERVRFSFVVGFTVLWVTIVYLPVAHWVWGGGWLAQRGTIDFAGGIVVHTTAGISALVAAIMIGARRGFPHSLIPPHSPGLTMAGGGMLWFGWFGFNGGSALAADGSAAAAILATQFAAAAASLTWMAIEWLRAGKPTSIGLVTGAIAGLATITPASGFVGPAGALIIGVVAGTVCFYVTGFVKQRLRIDDSLDVFAVHGVGGMVGALLVAILAAPALGGGGYASGMTMGRQFVAQATGVAGVAVWSAVATFLIIKLLAAITGLRVDAEAESDGLDLATHGERAYEHG